MFEEYTFDTLMEEALSNAPADIDTRQGSIFYDAVAGAMLKIAKLYADLDMLSELISIDTAQGEYLDRKAAEHTVFRLPATYSKYMFSFSGIQPEIGERFYTDGVYFTLAEDEVGNLFLMVEDAGEETNSIAEGTSAIPVNNMPGLLSATFGEILERGTNAESDDDLRDRLQDKISGPAENGNKQHYRTWCEQVDGVGRARIVPLWEGPNTVKGIIIDATGAPATASVVERVQNYIDPDMDNDGRGDGLGEGVANLGAHFTAVAPASVVINISCNIVLAAGITDDQAESQIADTVSAYLRDLTMNSDDTEIVIRLSAIGALIQTLPSVIDYNSLTLNNASENIRLTIDEVATMGEVNINVL